jgi:hypothetical protein
MHVATFFLVLLHWKRAFDEPDEIWRALNRAIMRGALNRAHTIVYHCLIRLCISDDQEEPSHVG